MDRSGRITPRNRRFIKEIINTTSEPLPNIIPSSLGPQLPPESAMTQRSDIDMYDNITEAQEHKTNNSPSDNVNISKKYSE